LTRANALANDRRARLRLVAGCVDGMRLTKALSTASFAAKRTARREIRFGPPLARWAGIPDCVMLTAHGAPIQSPEVASARATLIDAPFDNRDWVFETKWNGFRRVAKIENCSVILYSRSGLIVSDSYTPIAKALEKVRKDAIVDGELVALDEFGVSRFQLLQNALRSSANLHYCAFDIMFLDGKDLRGLPLVERKERLRAVLPKHPLLTYSEHWPEHGKRLFKEAENLGLEGIIDPPPMKCSDSRYGFATEEDCNGEEAQAGRDRCEVAAGWCSDLSQGTPIVDAIRSIGVTEVTYYCWRNECGGLKSDQVKRLWEVVSGRSRVPEGHTAHVGAVAFSPDGTHIVSGSHDNTLRLWEVASGQSRTLSGHTS
jgi:ATP dependent DNA ligase-like protein/WD40 domain-containing protein